MAEREFVQQGVVQYDAPPITVYEDDDRPVISFRERRRHQYQDFKTDLHSMRFRSVAGSIGLLISYELALAATRQDFFRGMQRDTDIRHYGIPVTEAFSTALQQYPGISVDLEVMAGAPCAAGTRIPVYMILDAIEHHGSAEGARQSYPKLTIEQIKDAIGFAKLVVECPIGDETASTSR
jgi:uncharacterized protein (DUF433 family)